MANGIGRARVAGYRQGLAAAAAEIRESNWRTAPASSQSRGTH
jgi:hypothetical protein